MEHSPPFSQSTESIMYAKTDWAAHLTFSSIAYSYNVTCLFSQFAPGKPDFWLCC